MQPVFEIAGRDDLEEIRKALKDEEFSPLSTFCAGSALGAAWWKEVVGDLWPRSILDFGDALGPALMALSEGCGKVVCRSFHCTFPREMAERILQTRPSCTPFPFQQIRRRK